MKCKVGIVTKPQEPHPAPDRDTARRNFLRRRAQALARQGPRASTEPDEPQLPAYLQPPVSPVEKPEAITPPPVPDTGPEPELDAQADLNQVEAEADAAEVDPENQVAVESEQELIEDEEEAVVQEEVSEAEAEEGEVEAELTGEAEPEQETLEVDQENPGQVLVAEAEDNPRPSAPSLPTPPPGMAAIRRQVHTRARAIPTPRITAGTAATREAEFVRQRTEREQRARREGVATSAADAMPPVPAELPSSLSSPDNPVPDIQQPLQRASNRTLPDQTPPALVRTPGNNLPQMGRRPLPPNLIRELSRFLEEGPQVSDPSNVARTRLQLQWEALMTQASPKEGKGEPQPLVDRPPPAHANVPPRNRATLSQALARLLQDPTGEARRMIERARGSAFVGGILNQVVKTQNLGSDMVADFAGVFGQQLDAIREEAGIAADDLDAAVETRRRELETQRHAEEERLQMSISDEGTAVSAENQAVADAIAGARRGMDEHAEEVQASAGGADRVHAIEARRDRLIQEVTGYVGGQDSNYRRAGETRATELDSLERAQIGAYRYAVQQDEFQLNQEPGERTQLQIQEEVAKSRAWLRKRERKVHKAFRALKTTASTTTQGNRDAIREAGNTSRQSIRDWASSELGEETSFWDRIIAMVQDWLGQAKANAQAWETVQNSENAEAASGYVDMMNQVQRAAAAGISEQQLLQGNQLTAEERAVIQAYFQEPRDPIYAVAVGIRERIYSQRSGELKSRLENLVLNGDFDWSVLEEIGRAYTPDFDAGKRASQLHGAFYPGITGLGTEEEEVFSALAGLNPVQVKAVRERYHYAYGETLDAALASEMDTDGERNRARALLSGNQSNADAAALHMAMEETWLGTGIGTEEDVIFRTLRNKSPEEIQAIVDAYRRDYGRDLRPLLREELNDWATLSSHDADRADALMASDTALADTIAVDQSLHGFSWGYAFNLAYGTSFEAGSRDEFTAVYSTIRQEVAAQATREQWTDAQFQAELQRRVQEIETRYNQRYPGRSLEGAVQERFGEGPNRDLVMATLNNDELRAEAARIAIENDHWLYASDDVINDVVERRYDRALEGVRRDREPELRRQMEAEIRRRDQQRFEQTGRRMTGPEVYALRQQLQVANERTMEREARSRAQSDTARMDQVYRQEYRESLKSAVERGTSGVTGERATTALSQGGYLTRYQRLDFATRVWGTDEKDAQRAFEGATPQEIAEMDTQWRRNHGGQSMRDGLLGGWSNLGFGELSGDDALDMQVSLEGRPMTLADAERIARLREQLAQPSSFLGIEIGGAEYELIAFRRQQLEQNAERLRRPVITEEDRRQRDHLLDEFAFNQEAVRSAVEQHRARVSAITDAIANTASMVVAIAVGAVITFFTGGTGAPVAIALIASLAGTMTSIGVRMAMLGNRYGWEQLTTDVGIGVLDAIVAAATAGIGNRLLGIRQAAGAVTSSATRTGLRGAVQNIQRRLGSALARLGDIGPLARRVPRSQLLSNMFNRGGYQRLLAIGVSESVENAVGALPTAVVTNMIDDRNWEGGFQFGNVLSGVATQVGMGVGMGLGMRAGMGGLGHLRGGIGRLINGPDIGGRPRLTTPDQLPINDAQYRSALREFQTANPGRSAAEFDAILHTERQGHLQDFMARNPGKTEADFDLYLREDAQRWRAEFEEMNRGRRIDFDAEQGRVSGEALARAHEEAQTHQAIRDELHDALPESRRSDLADIPISRLSDAEFSRATGRLTGDAEVVIRDGQAHLVVRKNASAASVRDAVGRLTEMTAPGTGGRVLNPAEALPRDLRGRVHVETNPELPPRSVQVHYESHNGRIVGIWVEAGPGARAVDIRMHAGTVRSMRRLQGISGQVRRALDQMGQWLGRHPRPAPGTRAFEAELELRKLPGIIEQRAQALSRATSLDEQLRIAAEIEHLQAQVREHSRFVDSIEAEPGRGYVAAESLTQAEVQQRIAQFDEPEVQLALRNLDPAEQAQVLLHFASMSRVLANAVDTPAQTLTHFLATWRRLRNLPDADPQITGRLLHQAGSVKNPDSHLRQLGQLVDRMQGLPGHAEGTTQRWLGVLSEAADPGHMMNRLNRVSEAIGRLPDTSATPGTRLLDSLVRSDDPASHLDALHSVVMRLGDATDANAARLGLWIQRAAAQSSPGRFITDLATTIRQVDEALGGANRQTIALLDRIQHVADASDQLAGLRGISQHLESAQARALLERISRWREPLPGGGRVAEYLGDAGRLFQHQTVRDAGDPQSYAGALARLLESGADANQRRGFLADVRVLLDSRRISADTLSALAERLNGLAPVGQRAVTPGIKRDYLHRVANFVNDASPLMLQIQAAMPARVNAAALLNDLLVSSLHFRSNSQYLSENLPAFMRALSESLGSTAPNHTAIGHILNYLSHFRQDPEGISADLMTSGRHIINQHGPLAKQNPAVLKQTLDDFAGNLVGPNANVPPRMAGRLTWEGRLAAAGLELQHALAGGSTAKARQQQSAAQDIQAATPGWTPHEQGMLMRQLPWMQELAATRNMTLSALLGEIVDLKQRFSEEVNFIRFRRRLRQRLLAEVFRDGVERPDMALLARILDNPPDSGAKGILFERFARRRFGRLNAEQALAAANDLQRRLEALDNPRAREWLTNAYAKLREWHPDLDSFDESRINGMRASRKGEGTRNLPGGRSADDVAIIEIPRLHMGGPGAGSMLIDYKAGKGAFQEAQARRYIKMLVDNAGQMVDADNVSHNGLIYIADSPEHAEHAMKQVQAIMREMEASGEIPPGSSRYVNIYFGHTVVDEFGVRLDFHWRPWNSVRPQ